MSRDQIVASFEAYNQLGRVTIRHSTAISALSTMQEDIFHVAEEKRVAMIVLPFHKQWRRESEEDIDSSVSHGWREVNRTVLQNAPCSVAVLVDRGFGCRAHQTVAEPAATALKRVCIVFFGGPDDRRALDLGGRMAENSGVKVTLVRFVGQASGAATRSIEERATLDVSTDGTSLDQAAVDVFVRKWDGSVEYEEKVMGTVKNQVLKIGQSREHELVVVGKGRFPSTVEAELADHQPENVGLGPIGNILASSDHRILASVLVIQQHNAARINEATM